MSSLVDSAMSNTCLGQFVYFMLYYQGYRSLWHGLYLNGSLEYASPPAFKQLWEVVSVDIIKMPPRRGGALRVLQYDKRL